MAKVLDSIRAAIETSGKTCYRISKDTDIAPSQLSRLMSGERGLSLDVLEQLAEHLGLEIIVRPKRGKTKGK